MVMSCPVGALTQSYLSRPSPNTCTHARTYSLTYRLARSHTCIHSLTGWLAHTHTYTHTCSLTGWLAHTCTHTCTSSELLSLLLVSSFSSASCDEETSGNEQRKRSRSKHTEGSSGANQYSLRLQAKAALDTDVVK